MALYRDIIGGKGDTWHEIGKLQYYFLVEHGLRPHHRFLDIACGSLRLGQFLIPMLDTGNYYGIEQRKDILDPGLEHELSDAIYQLKKPRFLVNGEFDFDTLLGDLNFDYAIAQSLFTHLTKPDIALCFKNLLEHYHSSDCPGIGEFYFTYLEGDSSNNPSKSHTQVRFDYQLDEIVEQAPGWEIKDIGDWGHPRNQLMALATPAE